jgi:hypothetical protein
MRRTLMIVVAALAAALMLVPVAAQANGSHHRKASKADSNRDRIPDRWERKHHLSLKVKQTRRDQDRDGLNNLGEFRAKTNPRDRDSDDDGVGDGAEHSGHVTSFENGVLTIALDGGGSVTGKVTDATRIECGEHAATTSRNDEGDDNSGDGDHSGPGRGDDANEPGDDQGDDEPGDDDGNDEPGDDHGNDANCTAANLVSGAVVREADLVIRDGAATFRKVELAS